MTARSVVVWAVLGCACGEKHEGPRGVPFGDILAAELGAAETQATPWRCASDDVPTLPDEEVKVDSHTWKASGTTLAMQDEDDEVVIGVIADAGGDEPQTMAALGRLRAQLEAAKPDIVVALGGMGATRTELEATLGTLADKATWPVVSLPGDLEPESAHTDAIANLRKKGAVVLDGRQIRTVRAKGLALRTLPGAGAAERLAAAGDGCAWTTADVAAAYSAVTAEKGVRVVAMAEAPRATIDGEAAGELALAASKAQPVEVVLHGPLEPAPTRAATGSRDGKGIVISPGTADATTRLPGPHRASAGVLVVHAGGWAWRPLVDAK